MASLKVFVFCIVLSLFGLINAHAQPRSFKAVYAASYKGGEIGQGILTLRLEQNRYHLELKIEPTGLLSIIPFSIHELAQGQLNTPDVHPARYAYKRSGLGKSRKETVIFDRDGIYREVKGERSVLPHDPAVKDPLSLILQVMLDLQAERLAPAYRVLNRGKIKDYPVQDQGVESIHTKLGQQHAQRIQRGSGDRLIQLWFDRDLGYVPLRIVELEDKREELSLKIRQLEWR